MQATRIIAIRHGETDWNAATRIQGHTDIALNANGVEQARQLGAALANEEIDAVYASDLSRAADTAQAIATHHKLTVHTHTGLRERHFGYFEGLVALKARVVNTLNELAAKHIGQHIVIAAHGGILDQLYRLANNLDLQTKRDWHLGNAAVNRLLWTPESLSLVIWGDTGHLHT